MKKEIKDLVLALEYILKNPFTTQKQFDEVMEEITETDKYEAILGTYYSSYEQFPVAMGVAKPHEIIRWNLLEQENPYFVELTEKILKLRGINRQDLKKVDEKYGFFTNTDDVDDIGGGIYC